MSELVLIGIAGIGVGVMFGLFGAGGSAFATPLLALLGVPPITAVASPLPAVLPASVAAARRHAGTGNLDRRLARLAVLGGVPGTLLGALASGVVGDEALLVLSGIVLLTVGVRVVLPDPASSDDAAARRRARSALVVGGAFVVGVLTGLLANGGGFLLVPMFVLGFGLALAPAVGTSMVAVGALTVPTLVGHIALGHVDWAVALAFAAGLVPASMLAASATHRLPPVAARRAFGGLLVAFAVFFLIRLFV